MSDLRLGTMLGRSNDDIVVADRLDLDGELLITFEDVGQWGSEDRYISRDEVRKLRDHLTALLETQD